MAIITKNRTIRPSTRVDSSSYRVKCDTLNPGDILQVNITHESDSSFNEVYEISYEELDGKNSIHFDADYNDNECIISWKANIRPRRVN